MIANCSNCGLYQYLEKLIYIIDPTRPRPINAFWKSAEARVPFAI